MFQLQFIRYFLPFKLLLNSFRFLKFNIINKIYFLINNIIAKLLTLLLILHLDHIFQKLIFKIFVIKYSF